MNELKLYHHVYTSIGGYKTVFASPELEPRVVKALEAFSDTLYPRVKQQTLRSVSHPSPSHICVSRIFRSSADHAGRIRSCVHNILLSKSELFELDYANPFSIPESLFLKTAPEATHLPSLSRNLVNRLEPKWPSIDSLKVSPGILAEPVARTVFSAITSNHDMALIAPVFDAFELLSSAGILLPPFLLLSTSIVPGTIFRSAHTEGATIYTLSQGYDTTSLTTEGVINYDTTSGMTANLPAPNRFSAFIISNLKEKPELVRKLAAVIHRYPIAKIASNDMYHNLVRAFEKTSSCFKEDGAVDALSDINAIADTLLTYFHAGYSELVLEALRQSFADLESKGGLTGSADILGQLEASLEDQQVQVVQKEAAISRIANWLCRSYACK